MRAPSLLLALLLVAPLAAAQTAPKPSPAAAPSSATAPNPAMAPLPASPPTGAAVPVQPASDAGATERGLAPVQPGAPGVTRRVQNANTHDVDARGHTLDPHGKPVGQAPSPAALPAPASTVH